MAADFFVGDEPDKAIVLNSPLPHKLGRGAFPAFSGRCRPLKAGGAAEAADRALPFGEGPGEAMYRTLYDMKFEGT